MTALKVSVLSLLFFCLPLSQVLADTTISYRGLRSGKAWIYIDGRLAKLRPGQRSKEGVKLLKANKKSITLIIDGKRYVYEKGKAEGLLVDNEVEVTRNQANGNYYVKGSINGKEVTFIVDTGASFVVLNKNDARALKIPLGKQKVKVSTATKDEYAHLVILKSVQIENIELNKITAVITNHNEHPRLPLLGMSFLEKLQISQSGNIMKLSYDGK